MNRPRCAHPVGLADLILLMEAFGPEVGRRMATFAGFEPPPEAAASEKTKESSGAQKAKSEPVEPAVPPPGRTEIKTFWDVPFWVVARREPIPRETLASIQAASEETTAPFQPPAPVVVTMPAPQPLVSPQRLDNDLRQLIGCWTPGRRLDLPPLVKRLAQGEMVRCLPRLSQRAWPRELMVVVDDSDHLEPYRADFWVAAKALQTVLGDSRMTIWSINVTGADQLFRWRPHGLRCAPFPRAHPDSVVLAFSDLGSLARDGNACLRWSELGKYWALDGARLVALSPAQPLTLPPDSRWDVLASGADGCTRLWSKPPAPTRLERQKLQQQWLPFLLSLVALTVQCSGDFLRRLAALLPPETFALGLPSLVWRHPHVVPGIGLIRMKSECLPLYQRFLQARREDRFTQELLDRAFALIRARHRRLNWAIGAEETALFPLQSGRNLAPDWAYFKQLETMMVTDQNQNAALYFDRLEGRLGHNTPLWTGDALMGRLCVHKRRLLPGHKHAPPPPGCERFVAALEGGFQAAKRQLSVVYRHSTLFLETFDAVSDPEATKRRGLLVTQLETCLPHILAGTAAPFLARLPLDGKTSAPLGNHRAEQFVLRTEAEILTLRLQPMPELAVAMEYEQGTLSLKLNEDHGGRTLRWLAPRSQTLPDGTVYHRIKGAWVDTRLHAVLDGENFPPPQWATRLGVDDYGVWAEFEVKGVTQRMRWIEAGTFNMGSDVAEGGEDHEQPKHPVWLTRPFWLADTACSQALWLALANENPSKFSGLDRPVENVSWRATVAFIQKLNQTLGTELFRLPREAEWEYACRAGTDTAFSSGDQLTKVQANFAGKQTVPVFSFLPNAWGLYQMHGNVWEWCDDGSRSYTGAIAVDPCEPGAEGPLRVNRGGSYWREARHCRSAYRNHFHPASAWSVRGFRLASGP